MSQRDPLAAAVVALTVALGCGGGGADDADANGPDADPTAPDGGAEVDAQTLVPCDPITQLGCAADEKCSLIPSPIYGEPPRIGCVPSSGSETAFKPCTPATNATPDDCARGLACVGTAAPRCLPFCTDYPVDTCGAGQACAFGEDLDGDWVVDVAFCAQTCDVLAQDCLDPTFACYPTREGAICAVEGGGERPAVEGEPCPYANSCAEGLGCFRIGVSLDWLCFALCDPYGSGGPTCGAFQICSPVEDELWGVCEDQV